MHPRGSGGHSWEPPPPPRWPEGPEIIPEASSGDKKFLKGFVTASLIIILLHVGLAYYFALI